MPAEPRRRWGPGGAALLATAVLTTLLLAACSGTPSTAERSAGAGAAGPGITSYAALGDSYTAAPFVPVTSLARGCLRSDHDYPAQLARLLGARLRDVSCSGASTRAVLHGQVLGYGDLRSRLRPQIAAVRPGTDLVTVGLGGNDGGLFGTLVRQCLAAAGQDSCAEGLRARLGDPARLVAATGLRVAGALRAVHRAAPDARVVLVGYPRVVAAGRGCRALPLAPADRRLLAGIEARLDRALAGAARRTGTAYLDLRTLSRGHEVCSPRPWVNGAVTDQQRAAAFHPFAEEQRAVAEALRALVEP